MRAMLPTLALFALTAAQAPQPSIEGHWKSPGGNSIIVIGPCGASLCGTIEWASEKAKQEFEEDPRSSGRRAAADRPDPGQEG